MAQQTPLRMHFAKRVINAAHSGDPLGTTKLVVAGCRHAVPEKVRTRIADEVTRLLHLAGVSGELGNRPPKVKAGYEGVVVSIANRDIKKLVDYPKAEKREARAFYFSIAS